MLVYPFLCVSYLSSGSTFSHYIRGNSFSLPWMAQLSGYSIQNVLFTNNKGRLIFSFYFYQIIFLSFISWLLKILVGLLSNSTTWILSPYCRCKSTGSSIHVGSSGGLYICNFVFPPTLNVSLLCQSLLLLLICIYMLIMQGHAILICESMFLNCSPWYHRTGRRHHLMWCMHPEQYMPIPLQHLYAL